MFPHPTKIPTMYRDLLRIKASNSFPQHPSDYISTDQLVEHYRDNPFVEDAVQGGQSLEEATAELAQVNTGINRLLPRRKDKGRNTQVQQLSRIIPEVSQLEANGVWYPDNPITVALYAAAAPLIIGYGLQVATGSDYLSAAAPIAIALTLFSATMSALHRCTPAPTDRARDIDAIIGEYTSTSPAQ